MNTIIQNILLQNKKQLQEYNGYDLLFQQINIPIQFNDFLEALKNSYVIYEKQDPQYFVKLLAEFQKLIKTHNNDFISDLDIKRIFPIVDNEKLPMIYVCIFDFSDKNQWKELIKNITKNYDNFGINIALNIVSNNSKRRGQLIDLTVINCNICLLLLNKGQFSKRTIYHQLTHYFQNVCHISNFKQKVQINSKKQKYLQDELLKFNLSLSFVKKYFLSDKQFITHKDNLIYLIHQLQKIDNDGYNKFIQEFSTNDPKCLKSQLAKTIINIDKTFDIDILFFISCYICLGKKTFNNLVINLKNRI